jgi:hypothetical protein
MSKTKRTLLTLTVKQLIDDYIYRIDLDADYQREKIWSRKSQEELLDSIIRNIDIPKIYLAKTKNNEQFEFECIDGKQRMGTLLSFFKPEVNEGNPLTVRVTDEPYTYETLTAELPSLARKIEEFQLSFVVYSELDEELTREIFRRLQLGVRLNSGEMLKTYTGTIRDFVYKEIGDEGPFLRYTKLSDKRFSKQFTLAQICINSFKFHETGDFGRARYEDLKDFFQENETLEKDNENLVRIRAVLKLMGKHFGKKAEHISSRAIAVSAYLSVEGLYLDRRMSAIPNFVNFYLKLLHEIKVNMDLLSQYETPVNSVIMEQFQKYILQASVEPSSIRRRNDFLKVAFKHYLTPKTKGEIIQNMSDLGQSVRKLS